LLKIFKNLESEIESLVGQGVDHLSRDNCLHGIADGLGDVLHLGDAVNLGDDVAALGDAGLVDDDRAVDAVLGGHLLAGLSDSGVVVNRKVSRAESVRSVKKGISLTFDQNGSAEGNGRLWADDGDDVLALLLVADFLVDDISGDADTFVVRGAGLGLEGFSFSSAGVDGVFDGGHDGGSFDDGRSDSFSRNCGGFGNRDGFGNLGNDFHDLRGSPGNCNETQQEELEKHVGKLDFF